MGYFNEGNDCDMCRHQIMTGQDGTVEDCRRRELELPCKFEERDIRTCPVCNAEVDREDMDFTRDCHGITFRLVCYRCWKRLMSKGYDGEYYTDEDEQIEDDY
ncbi:MAG: hypothetical protein NC347_14600 [Clostridium sp.]|nr:hypothetical protein [Clostridium sp.]